MRQWSARIFAVLSLPPARILNDSVIFWFWASLCTVGTDIILLTLCCCCCCYLVFTRIPFSFCGEFQLMSVCAAKTFRRYGVICLCSILSAPSIAPLTHHTAAAAPHRLPGVVQTRPHPNSQPGPRCSFQESWLFR